MFKISCILIIDKILLDYLRCVVLSCLLWRTHVCLLKRGKNTALPYWQYVKYCWVLLQLTCKWWQKWFEIDWRLFQVRAESINQHTPLLSLQKALYNHFCHRRGHHHQRYTLILNFSSSTKLVSSSEWLLWMEWLAFQSVSRWNI